MSTPAQLNKNSLQWAAFTARQNENSIAGSYFQRVTERVNNHGEPVTTAFTYSRNPGGVAVYEVMAVADGSSMHVRLGENHVATTDPQRIRNVLGAVATLNNEAPLIDNPHPDRDVPAYEEYANGPIITSHDVRRGLITQTPARAFNEALAAPENPNPDQASLVAHLIATGMQLPPTDPYARPDVLPEHLAA